VEEDEEEEGEDAGAEEERDRKTGISRGKEESLLLPFLLSLPLLRRGCGCFLLKLSPNVVENGRVCAGIVSGVIPWVG
jgi:hypothetical protein